MLNNDEMPIFFLPSWRYPVVVNVNAADNFIIPYLPGKRILRSLVSVKGYPELICSLEGNLAVFYNFLQILRGFATILITNFREAENDKQDTDH
jgi:hypothetical protein